MREGYQVRVAHPEQVKLIWHARCKTDPVDPRKLADLLRTDLLLQTVYRSPRGGGRFERPHILLPATLVDEPAPDVPSLLRFAFDMFWQAAGWEASPDFDSSGRWTLTGRV